MGTGSGFGSGSGWLGLGVPAEGESAVDQGLLAADDGIRTDLEVGPARRRQGHRRDPRTMTCLTATRRVTKATTGTAARP